jgi:glycosyltransferase involved in cell wall biosynthesis
MGALPAGADGDGGVTSTASPPVSVCIAACDEERGIRGALESVAAQDWDGEIEIVVCANGCGDRTEEVVRAFAALRPVRLLSTAEQGKPLAWNLLVRAAAHDLIAFVDADVRLAPDAVGVLVRRLDASRELVAVGALSLPVLERCDRLTRWLCPARTDQGCLVGRLYVVRRAALLAAMVRRGYDSMPLDLIHEDVWLTMIAGRGRWDVESAAIVHFAPPHWSERLSMERRAIRAERQLKGAYAHLLEPRDEALLFHQDAEKLRTRRRERWRSARTWEQRVGVVVNSVACRVARAIGARQVDREQRRPLNEAFERSRSARSGPSAAR